MPLEVEDVFPGVIAYFTINALRRHPRVATTHDSPCGKSRPFVCYALDGGDVDGVGVAYWIYLTSVPKPRRKRIAAEWVRGPKGDFCKGEALIIGDCRDCFAGPAELFARLSVRCDGLPSMARPFLAPQGVAEVRAAVASRGGLLPPTDRPPMRLPVPQVLRRAG